MPKIRIPERHRPGLKLIASLEDATVSAVRAALQEHPSLDPGDLAKHLESANISREDRRKVLEALLPLYIVKEETNSSPDEMADTVSEAMSSHWEEDTSLELKDRLKANLRSLLDLSEVGLRAKISGLLMGDEKTFCDVRIVTDLRPAFGRDVNAGPLGMGLIHLLTIGYHSRGDTHLEFQVALSTGDLKKLREAVERAEKKSQILLDTLKKADIRHVGDEVND